MVTETDLFQIRNRILLDFCLWIWTQVVVYNRKIIKWGKFLARTVYAAARTEKREDQLRQKRRDICELQSALKLTARYSNIYCKLQQIFNLDIKLK